MYQHASIELWMFNVHCWINLSTSLCDHSEFSPDGGACGAPPLCNFWAPLCSLLKYENLLNNVVTFHAKICINEVRMHSPIALHFFKHFERRLARSFYSNKFDVRQEMLNLHCLSLLAHMKVSLQISKLWQTSVTCLINFQPPAPKPFIRYKLFEESKDLHFQEFCWSKPQN